MSVAIVPAATGIPPIVGRLQRLFESLPDGELLAVLRGPKRRGRPGYDPEILWRCFVTYYALGVESVSALLRLLEDNPFIAEACGVAEQMPSQPTMSRFIFKLSRKWNSLAVKNIFRKLTLTLYETLPDFGKSVAIDSTDIKAWSNGGKTGLGRVRHMGRKRQRKVSDPEAGWIVKANTEGNKKYVFGYKVHILCDTTHELPIAVDVTAGNVHDSRRATPLLAQARYVNSRFLPDYVMADAAYSSEALRKVIKQQYWAEPVIDPNPTHKKAIKKHPVTQELKVLYRRRTAVERLNGRLKGFYKLNDVRVRGRMKVVLHALMSSVVLLARAVENPKNCRSRLTR